MQSWQNTTERPTVPAIISVRMSEVDLLILPPIWSSGPVSRRARSFCVMGFERHIARCPKSSQSLGTRSRSTRVDPYPSMHPNQSLKRAPLQASFVEDSHGRHDDDFYRTPPASHGRPDTMNLSFVASRRVRSLTLDAGDGAIGLVCVDHSHPFGLRVSTFSDERAQRASLSGIRLTFDTLANQRTHWERLNGNFADLSVEDYRSDHF